MAKINYYSHVNKLQEQIQEDINQGMTHNPTFYEHDSDLHLYYVVSYGGTAIYCIPEKEFNLVDCEPPAAGSLRSSKELRKSIKRMWEDISGGNYHIVQSITKKGRKEIIFEGDNQYFHIRVVVNSALIPVKLDTKKYNFYINGSNKPVLIYANDATNSVFGSPVAMVFPIVGR